MFAERRYLQIAESAVIRLTPQNSSRIYGDRPDFTSPEDRAFASGGQPRKGICARRDRPEVRRRTGRGGGARRGRNDISQHFFLIFETSVILPLSRSGRGLRLKKRGGMAVETVPAPRRCRLNVHGREVRRARIFARLREGWGYSDIARAEGLTGRRIRQIVSKALEKRTLDTASDHALLQLAARRPVGRRGRHRSGRALPQACRPARPLSPGRRRLAPLTTQPGAFAKRPDRPAPALASATFAGSGRKRGLAVQR